MITIFDSESAFFSSWVCDTGGVETKKTHLDTTERPTVNATQSIVRLRNLNGFFRPVDGSKLIDAQGNHLGDFDFHSSDRLYLRRPANASPLYADGWLDLLAQICAVFGCE